MKTGSMISVHTFDDLDRAWFSTHWEEIDFEIDFRPLDVDGLDGRNFCRLNLRMVNFAGALLPQALFRLCDLTLADFNRAQLQGARFEFSDLCHASFHASSLYGASFTNVELDYAEFSECDLRSVKMESVNTHGANWMGALFDESSRFPFSQSEAIQKGLIFRPQQGVG